MIYQLIDGITKEDVLFQKNTRGYVEAEAKKIGAWSESLGRFELVKWVPQSNAPVFCVTQKQFQLTRSVIGHFPRTSYPVLVDQNLLVTHNAAILGILGAGKSFLAIELIERMIDVEIKVVCLDLTNQ